MTSASKVRSLASFVKSGSTDLPGPEIWASLVRDYEHIAANIDSCGRRLEAMTLIITSFIMIAESRRSFLETMNVSRLTYLALIFVLLTFVSSLFSMAGDTAPGAKDSWVYFAVAIPALALVFLIARPPNRGIPWIIDYLLGRRGRKLELTGWDPLDTQSSCICRLTKMHCGALHPATDNGHSIHDRMRREILWKG
jgi:hypothetical protein